MQEFIKYEILSSVCPEDFLKFENGSFVACERPNTYVYFVARNGLKNYFTLHENSGILDKI